MDDEDGFENEEEEKNENGKKKTSRLSRMPPTPRNEQAHKPFGFFLIWFFLAREEPIPTTKVQPTSKQWTNPN